MRTLASTLVAAAIALAISTHAEARVHIIPPAQTFYLNDATSVRNVAMYGQYAIAIIGRPGGRKAVLFVKGDHDIWSMGPTLLDVDTTDESNDDLVMDNGVAAIRIGKYLHIFEHGAYGYQESGVAGTPQPAQGLVMYDHSILAARPGCAYDANLFEKSRSSGAWRVNGRITGQTSDCNPYTAMAIEGDMAIMRNSPTQIGQYFRNGAFDWTLASTISAPPGVTFQAEPLSLYAGKAFTGDGRYYQWSSSGWSYLGRVKPLDSGNGTEPTDAKASEVSTLLTLSTFGGQHDFTQPYLYHDDGHDHFVHSAILQTVGSTLYVDSYYYQAITSEVGYLDNYTISFFTLPGGIAPRAIANDFDARDLSGIQQTQGNGFALADAGGNYVYRQSDVGGEDQATLSPDAYSNSQFVEADVTPTAFDGSDRWAAIAVRYAGYKNQYYLTLRSSNMLQLKKKVGGEYTTLAEERVTVTPGKTYHLRLGIVGSHLTASIDGGGYLYAEDTSLLHGSAALMTNHARADFDNVYVALTDTLGLANKPYSDQFTDQGEPFTTQGGSWTPSDNPDDERISYSQTSTSGDTRAFIGTPTDDQRIDTTLRVDSWGSSTSGAWAGVLARWVDSKNYYYLTVRSTGRLEIRKQVNGVITTLKSVPFTATPGRFYKLRFEVLGNELHAFVDGKFMAGALDNDIAEGQYGLGSYRAAFTYQNFDAVQP